MRSQKDEDHFLNCKLRFSKCEECQKIAKEINRDDDNEISSVMKEETRNNDSRINRIKHQKEIY
jgi:hypothetical protein